MNLKDFEYLIALHRHQHFRKAAEACFVSQPTLSGQIKKLEQELGTVLLERNNRQVLFTELGEQLVEQAKKILVEVKTFKELADTNSQEMVGRLKVGFIPTVGPYLLPKFIPQLKQTYPDLKLELHEDKTSNLVRRLQQGELDCLILAAVADTQVLKEIHLFHEPMLIAVSSDHPWAEKDSIDLTLLAGEKVLALTEGNCFRDQALGFCMKAGAIEDNSYQSTSIETLRNMVATGAGLSLLPQMTTPTERQKDGVSYIAIAEPAPSREITLAYRPGSPLATKFNKLAELITI